MPDPSQYWTMSEINPATGNCRQREIPTARDFLTEQFPTFIVETDLSTSESEELQQQLWQLCCAAEPSVRAAAALALRCYISYAASIACFDLVTKFGSNPTLSEPLTCEVLLPWVLDDEGEPLQFLLSNECYYRDERDQKTGQLHIVVENQKLAILNPDGTQCLVYKPFSFDILASYNFCRQSRYSLKNWTILKVKQYKPIDETLRSHGIIRITSWRLLRTTSPRQLRQIEALYSLSPDRIQQDIALLILFQATYQQERLSSERSATRSPMTCSLTKDNPLMQTLFDWLQTLNSSMTSLEEFIQWSNPIARLFPSPKELTEQLNAIAKSLTSVDDLIERLNEIADLLRQYKAKQLQVVSTGQPDPITGKMPHDKIPATPFKTLLEEQEKQTIEQFNHHVQQEFKPLYEQQQLALLDRAITWKIQSRLDYLDNSARVRHKAPSYFPALHYYYIDNLTIKEINQRLALTGANLIQPKQFLADSKRHMLKLLQTLFLNWAKDYVAKHSVPLTEVIDRSFLEETSTLWTAFLDEQIQEISDWFQEAENEVHPGDSLVFRRIRHCLNADFAQMY